MLGDKCVCLLLVAGYQHIRMYDLNSSNPNPIINYEGVSKNVTGVGFQEEGKWMYTGGEDCSARIWDLRYCSMVLDESVNHDSYYHFSQINLIQEPVWRIRFTTNITTTCHWTLSRAISICLQSPLFIQGHFEVNLHCLVYVTCSLSEKGFPLVIF